MQGLHFLGRPVNILQYRAQHHGDQQIFRSSGAAARIINTNVPFGGLIEAYAALQRNELVCLMGDRTVSRSEQTMAVPFLGGTVHFPTTAYHLASLARAPIAVLFVIRGEYAPEYSPHVKGGNLHLYFAEVLEPPEQKRHSSEGLQAAVQAFAAALEKLTQQYPYQFFNFYDLWKQERI